MRNRDRILDAIYELVRGGALQPTVKQIARKAGVGERSVFRHFEDLERLHADMGQRVQREVLKLAMPLVPGSGPLPERVSALVRHRSKIFEHIAPFRRAGNARMHASAVIRRQHDELAAAMRADLLRVFSRELSGARQEICDAAEAMSSFETWERLRLTQRLNRSRAAQVVETALLRLLV
jgi:AcrR family transcriptional regulator